MAAHPSPQTICKQLDEVTGFPFWQVASNDDHFGIDLKGKHIVFARLPLKEGEQANHKAVSSFTLNQWLKQPGLGYCTTLNNAPCYLLALSFNDDVIPELEKMLRICQDMRKTVDRGEHPDLQHIYFKREFDELVTDRLKELNPKHLPSLLLGKLSAADADLVRSNIRLTKKQTISSWLRDLTEWSVQKSNDPHVSESAKIISLVKRHIPALTKTIEHAEAAFAYRRDVPELPSEPLPTRLAVSMQVDKAGLGMIGLVEGNAPINAAISLYSASLECKSHADAERLRTYVIRALEKVAGNKPQDAPAKDRDSKSKPGLAYERPEMQEYKGGKRLKDEYISIEDGHTVKIHSKLSLEDLWGFYDALRPVIEPNASIAHAMDNARWREYRGVPKAADFHETLSHAFSTENLDDPILRRGSGYRGTKSAILEAKLADLKTLTATGDMELTYVAQRLMDLAKRTMSEDYRDEKHPAALGNQLPPLPHLLEHTGGAVDQVQVKRTLAERTTLLAEHMLGRSLEGNLGETLKTEIAGLSQELSDADRSAQQKRYTDIDKRHAERFEREVEETLRRACAFRERINSVPEEQREAEIKRLQRASRVELFSGVTDRSHARILSDLLAGRSDHDESDEDGIAVRGALTHSAGAEEEHLERTYIIRQDYKLETVDKFEEQRVLKALQQRGYSLLDFQELIDDYRYRYERKSEKLWEEIVGKEDEEDKLDKSERDRRIKIYNQKKVTIKEELADEPYSKLCTEIGISDETADMLWRVLAVYESRLGLPRSSKLPRLELPEELQVILDQERKSTAPKGKPAPARLT